jgi:hypothetical protein
MSGVMRGSISLSHGVICSYVDTSGTVAGSLANGMLGSGDIRFR